MRAIVIGDRFVELDAPDAFVLEPDTSAPVLVDPKDPDHVIELAMLTVSPHDPVDTDVCTRRVRADADDHGGTLVEIRTDLVYRIEQESTEGRRYEHWHVGWGNRLVLVTRSYPETRAREFETDARRAQLGAMVGSLRPTHEPLPPVEGAPVIRELVPSQRAWLERIATQLAARCDGELTLVGLDACWQELLDDPPEGDDLYAALDELGVALGHELVRSRHRFEWAVITDAWGTAMAVVAYRGAADVVIDPFSLVAKRWDSQAAPFFADTVAQLIRDLDPIATN